MDKNYVIIALVSALATFLLMAILGAVLLEDEPERSYQPTSDDMTAQELFMTSCKSQDAPDGLCSCAWDKLTDRYTVMEIAEMGSSETFPPEFYDIRDQCLAETNAQQI